MKTMKHIERRGVVLLVVLAILAIFGLIAVAFVVLTGQARRSARSVENIGLVTDPPQKILQQAAMQVFHGPTTNPTTGVPNPASVMGAHSLLEDIYGNDYLKDRTISSIIASGSGGQVLKITSNDITPAEIARRGGCVLTITKANTEAQKALVGQSTRIVSVDTSDTSPTAKATFCIAKFPDATIDPTGATFTINGVPFSGTGFGCNTSGAFGATVSITGVTDPCELALLPNYSVTNDNRNPLGGANEDYDAADFQNMLLAAQVVNTGALGGVQTLPSMHRPALVRYWAQKALSPTPASDFSTVADNITAAQKIPIDLKRAIIMRPLPEDHPDFTGSNPTYQPTDQKESTNLYKTGFNPCWDGRIMTDPATPGVPLNPQPFSWDVDNDGDGIPDSVWIDLGFPVRSTSDGRLFKPLFAVLCVDLDGRLNVNAHGSLQQTDTDASPAADHYNTLVTYAAGSQISAKFAGPTGTEKPTARGQGFGPAEISLSPLVGNLYSQIFTGGTYNATNYQGRYGYGNTSVPGVSVMDTLSQNLWFEYAQAATDGTYGTAYWALTAVANAGSYGSPPDPFGVGAVGLDQAGRPVYAGFNYGGTDYVGFGSGVQNNPYEMNFNANVVRGLPMSATATATTNNPFSATEMERLLRPYDRDATSLPIRLEALTYDAAPTVKRSMLLPTYDKGNNKSFTTDSWDLPCPSVLLPRSLTGTSGTLTNNQARHVTDLLVTRGVDKAYWGDLLPADLLAGLKMNINRPFGNGQDENGNGVIDEAEADPPEGTNQAMLSDVANTNLSYSETGKYKEKSSGTETTTTPLAARQLEARYLYVMMCLTCDLKYLNNQFKNITDDPTGTKGTARYIAQWAVNVVDFKDRDSIMTPFDYDVTFADPDGNNAGGWNAVAGTAPRVWGCERPELLISETLAFHDRRTQNLSAETVATIEDEEGDEQTEGGLTTDVDVAKKDASYDQAFRPQGSLFIELYNPLSPLEPRSSDLQSMATGGVELTKVSTSGNSPVWRMLITNPNPAANEEELDPDDPDSIKRPTTEREVYFVDSTTANIPTTLTNAEGRFRPSTSPGTVVVPPCGYAVIGSGESASKRTYIGFEDGKTAGDPDTTRHIDLAASTTAFPVHKNTNIAPPPEEPTTTNANLPVVMAIDAPRRLSVSEPVGGYITTGYDNTASKYVPPLDIPLDSEAKRDDGGEAFRLNGTTAKYRIIYLQRLANPLLPYNATTNPYRTVDQMAVDVTAFNGVCNDSNSTDPDPAQTGNTLATHFQSRQRGENNQEAGRFNIWKEEPAAKTFAAANDAPDLSTNTTINTHYFAKGLNHSLGYLNHAFGVPVVDSATSEKGLPSQPFPWLTWNNRPYVTPLELMFVPVLRSSKLLANAGANSVDDQYNLYYRILPSSTAVKPYDPAINVASELCLAGADVPYPHLMNFFQSGISTATGTATGASPQFHRILEYLGVPSPFIGTGTWASSAVPPYLPPFNRISSYREPGRINLNTIYEKNVFKGLMAGFPTMANDTYWSKVVRSRRGHNATNATDILEQNSSYPTEFGNPFRSFGGWTMTPEVLKPTKNREINVTLLRSDPDSADETQALFQSPDVTEPTACNNTDRNPYFRYQGITRLGNLVTTRSNVYAVWITVGYFEVTPAPSGYDTAIYPDGYTLGRELGIDTGEIERHRAFYIFDRTIPVGFQRGNDLNVEKAILVNRFIE